MIKQWSLVLMLALALVGHEAEAARRLGGGKSMGSQSSNVTQRQAAPATPGAPAAAPNATPATPAANPAAAAAPRPATPAPAAAAPKRPWGAMLGGLAAGLGLAWLAHSLGFGEAFGQMLMFGLLAMVIMAVVGFVLSKRRAASQSAASNSSPFAFQGAGNAPASAPVLRQYSPDHVGNDASARPWERHSQFEAPAADASARPQASGVQIGSALAGGSAWAIPAGFDTPGFLDAAKRNFVTLQAAWDRSDLDTLRSMMTDGMLDEIRVQLTEREAHRNGGQNTTDVVMLEAQLLGIEDLGEGYMASVEFSGMIREEPSAGPNPFREVWNMTKPKDGRTGWLVAGVQALQ